MLFILSRIAGRDIKNRSFGAGCRYGFSVPKNLLLLRCYFSELLFGFLFDGSVQRTTTFLPLRI